MVSANAGDSVEPWLVEDFLYLEMCWAEDEEVQHLGVTGNIVNFPGSRVTWKLRVRAHLGRTI